MMPIQFFFVSPTWPHPAAPAQSQRCPGSLNLLPTNEKQEALLLNLHHYTRIGRGMPFEIEIPGTGQSCSDVTSLLIILVLLSIPFPALPFPLHLLAQDVSSRLKRYNVSPVGTLSSECKPSCPPPRLRPWTCRFRSTNKELKNFSSKHCFIQNWRISFAKCSLIFFQTYQSEAWDHLAESMNKSII